jgi:hypothetical protein
MLHILPLSYAPSPAVSLKTEFENKAVLGYGDFVNKPIEFPLAGPPRNSPGTEHVMLVTENSRQ